MNKSEGYVPFKGNKTYYKIVGKPSKKKCPLLVLHGGPASAHNYLLGLGELAKNGHQVIFYDQLGCGLSDHPDDDSLWTIQTFLEELSTIRKELKLDTIHLLGHSWGGILAIEYLLTQPDGVKSTILASSMISIPLYLKELEKLKAALEPNVYQALKKHEAAGTTDSSLYQWAYGQFKRQYLFRGEMFPEELSAPAGTTDGPPYEIMWGPSEAYANGTLRSWDRTKDLPKIKIPTLITSGQYDELTPWQAALTRDQIPNSTLKIFTNGSHLVHVEQQAEYVKVVADFLADTEKLYKNKKGRPFGLPF